jgi:hypothetical protein
MSKFLTALAVAVALCATPVHGQSTFSKATLTSATCPGSGCVLLSVTGVGGAAVQITGTYSGTLSFEGSVDGVTFTALNLTPIASTTPATSTTSTGVWSGGVGGLTVVRVRMSSYASGSAFVTIQAAPTSARGGGGGGGTPGGSDTQLQYNNAGAFGGIPVTWSAASTQLSIGGQYFAPLIDDGNSSTADTIDWNSGNEHMSTLTGNVTYTFSNPVNGGRYVLVLATGAGSFSATWPATVLWPGGATPTITTTASKVDVCTFIYVSSVTKYYGACSQNY